MFRPCVGAEDESINMRARRAYHYWLKKLPVRREISDIMGMEYLLDRKGKRRLTAYFDRIGGVLMTAPQRT